MNFLVFRKSKRRVSPRVLIQFVISEQDSVAATCQINDLVADALFQKKLALDQRLEVEL